MKVGDLVKTLNGRIGIIKAYHPLTKMQCTGTSYPWYVYMMDSNWHVEYFQTQQLELISEGG
tara:strand:+ start:912 stop:1097 length:186 start_codon:yes stop_codon:yes gene_type:complete